MHTKAIYTISIALIAIVVSVVVLQTDAEPGLNPTRHVIGPQVNIEQSGKDPVVAFEFSEAQNDGAKLTRAARNNILFAAMRCDIPADLEDLIEVQMLREVFKPPPEYNLVDCKEFNATSRQQLLEAIDFQPNPQAGDYDPLELGLKLSSTLRKCNEYEQDSKKCVAILSSLRRNTTAELVAGVSRGDLPAAHLLHWMSTSDFGAALTPGEVYLLSAYISSGCDAITPDEPSAQAASGAKRDPLEISLRKACRRKE